MALAWLIGENNPYSEDPQFALYPRPRRAAGYRLCAKILGLHERTYLEAFARRNLLSQLRWSTPSAKLSATYLKQDPDKMPFILCGAKVAAAFGLPTKPFEVYDVGDVKAVVIPHPSGLSRAWNEPDAIERARYAVKVVVPALADKLGEADV